MSGAEGSQPHPATTSATAMGGSPASTTASTAWTTTSSTITPERNISPTESQGEYFFVCFLLLRFRQMTCGIIFNIREYIMCTNVGHLSERDGSSDFFPGHCT